MKNLNLIVTAALLLSTPVFAGETAILKSLTSLGEIRAAQEAAMYRAMSNEIRKIGVEFRTAAETGVEVSVGQKESIHFTVRNYINGNESTAKTLIFRLANMDDTSEEFLAHVLSAAKKIHYEELKGNFQSPPEFRTTILEGPDGLIGQVQGESAGWFVRNIIFVTRQLLKERAGLPGAAGL